MENFFRKNNALYHNITDMNRCSQLMSTQMGSSFAMRNGGYSNPKGPKLLMSSPYESFKYDNAENIDPQIAMSMNSCSSSSGHNSTLPLAVNMARYPGGYDCSPLSFVGNSGNSGNSCSASASKSPSVVVNTQLRLEDDVLVMDEVFVVNALDGRSRSGKDSNGSSAYSDQSYKKDVCSSWAETRSCRFGSNCQFSHRKEDLTLPKFSDKGKPELDVRFSKITSATYFEELKRTDFKGHNSRPPKSCGAVSYGRSPQGFGTIGNIRGSPADGSGSGNSRGLIAPRDNRLSMTCLDWMPQDDGINARPPGSDNPSQYEVLECINNHLYASRVKNRLPVFTAIFHSPASATDHVQQIIP